MHALETITYTVYINLPVSANDITYNIMISFALTVRYVYQLSKLWSFNVTNMKFWLKACASMAWTFLAVDFSVFCAECKHPKSILINIKMSWISCIFCTLTMKINLSHGEIILCSVQRLSWLDVMCGMSHGQIETRKKPLRWRFHF